MTNYMLVLLVSPNAIATQTGAYVEFKGVGFPGDSKGTITTADGITVASFNCDSAGTFTVKAIYNDTPHQQSGITRAMQQSTAMNYISVFANVEYEMTTKRSNTVDIFF